MGESLSSMTTSVSCANIHVSVSVCMCKRGWKWGMQLLYPLLVNLLSSELKVNLWWKGSSRERRVTSLFPKTLTPFLSWHATVLYKVSQYRGQFHALFHSCEFCSSFQPYHGSREPALCPLSGLQEWHPLRHWVSSLYLSQCRKAWFSQYLSQSWFSGSSQQFLHFSWELVGAFFWQGIY